MTISVKTRQAVGPEDAARRDTQGLRDGFVIEDVFRPGEICLTYSHLDRMIVGGASPVSGRLMLDHVAETGTEHFLDRREAAIVNIGGRGTVSVGGTKHVLGAREALYVGLGAGALEFASEDAGTPALFYLLSAPAHRPCPTVLITRDMAKKVSLGSAEESNARTINQYVHPDVCESCQLLVGLTMFEPGSVWNTMPAHVHDRRMEVYLYFGMQETTRIFHFMGEPGETRHVVLKNHEAVLSPGWSIHSGAGTGRYAFIWAMAGDNMSFTDMDKVPMEALR
ncbi:5-dehydro-4-deoxy-D-glucuronate isomerase [Rhizobium sp. TRM96647]|uniref:5-dehydro-4-deoxy-D-glucuronate isomerase n=1 Tax=unclassified Rhizobium TaxID=2613769 RepID=UPI0021E877C2|nr:MULTISPECIES: 5-dehydro-4-deoxy-D-glucuronate isomerase [unclassified Rhizobium]MCV3736204.1 5-dehydro-4-deoxy-D-glucuronate isomerase [Rhizobium sp. TRM96647]MCV3758134.1 5-dehydro-4-deoxy-D-glucuronate isomerase [Rhizobium sp. TRM96650]